MVSIGQQAFFGFGGYTMLILGNEAGVNPFISIPLAAMFTTLIAWPVSLLAFRLQGGYFAIGSWVIAEVFRLSFANLHWVRPRLFYGVTCGLRGGSGHSRGIKPSGGRYPNADRFGPSSDP